MARAFGGYWCVLTAVCTLMWGVYFIYDLPASLSSPLQAHLGLSDSKYAYLVSALYTAYAAPNTILSFFSGPLVQRFGEKFALLLTLTSVVFGQLVFALSVQTQFQPGMILGRIFLGLGGEVMGVLGCEITTRWFRDKCLSLALAMNLASWRLGSVTNSILIPRLAKAHGVVAAGWMGTGFSLGVSILSALYLISIDNSTGGKRTDTEESNDEEEETGMNVNFLSSLAQCPRIFWQLGLICMLGYGSINTFTNSAQRFLAFTFYCGDQRAAGSATSVPYILSSVLVPPLGLLLDLPLFNHYPAALVITNFLMLLAHLLFLTSTKIGPILPLSLLGTAYALFGVVFWTSLTRCLIFVGKTWSAVEGRGIVQDVSEREYGTIDSGDANQGSANSENHQVITFGFGVMTSLMNLSTGAVPILLAGAENLAGYAGLEMVFLALAGFGCLVSVQSAWMWNGI